MMLKLRRAFWGWGVRVDKDGVPHDSFVPADKEERKVKTKWRVRPRKTKQGATVKAE